MRKKEWFVNGVRMIPTEEEEQAFVISWCEVMESRWPELSLMHHIPNGGKRGKAEAARFKRQGVKAGVSDLFLPVARCGYHGLYIEMKAMDGEVSGKQEWFLAAVREQGYFGAVCFGGGEAVELIQRYMEGVGV